MKLEKFDLLKICEVYALIKEKIDLEKEEA